jgi:VanZ family protein
MKAHYKYYWPAIWWAVFIFILCTIQLGPISKSPLFFPGFDKLVHCGLFFMMVVLYCNGFIRQQSSRIITYKSLTIITLAAVCYGGLIELLQAYVFTWRSGEWNDLFADAVGASMGAFGIMITVKAINYVKK